ncbi:MAG: hypothetical protein HUU55_09625 [Myxococcales bacterium]|nr:hypothetical protein [Myxococcales bacterium]
MSPKAMFQVILVIITTQFGMGCGGSKVLTKDEMDAQRRVRIENELKQSQEEEKAAEAKSKRWSMGEFNLEQELELFRTDRFKLRNHDIYVQLLKTGWTTIKTPKGDSHSGWARLLVSNGDGTDSKEVQIAEDDYGFAMGFRIDVRYAYEHWDKESSEYIPHAKIVVHRQ